MSLDSWDGSLAYGEDKILFCYKGINQYIFDVFKECFKKVVDEKS